MRPALAPPTPLIRGHRNRGNLGDSTVAHLARDRGTGGPQFLEVLAHQASHDAESARGPSRRLGVWLLTLGQSCSPSPAEAGVELAVEAPAVGDVAPVCRAESVLG